MSRITKVETTALLVPYTKTYHWAQGAIDGAEVVLVSVHTEDGIVGHGESIGTPSVVAIRDLIEKAGALCVGHSVFENAGLMATAYHALFQGLGTCSSPRFGGQVLAGLEMALWDAMGKCANQPAHALLGGKVRDEIQYFGFAQGDSPTEIAAEAGDLAKAGFEVIYVKVGRGDSLDREIVSQVRAAIGPTTRLRIDPNEKWKPAKAARMIRELSEFGLDFVEQPTPCESLSALAQVHAASPVAIAADQTVFTPEDAFDVCRAGAADVIVLGLHETGGLTRFAKTAHIAEAAGIDICLHGLYETGITTSAANQIAATLRNLDDGNQYMNHFLAWDIIQSPDLTLDAGRLPVLTGPGLGFELDWDAVERAKALHAKSA